AHLLPYVHTLLPARHVMGPGDLFFYDGTANLLADGRGYIDPYLSTAGHPYPTALHPPLWPFSLALASKLGVRSLLGHRLVGCIFGTATVVLIGLIGRRVGGERLGLVAAGIAALYPTLVAADCPLMSESLYGMFLAAARLLL